ncbi:MarR family winged helix-turn-helix transcriptional regulator [Streptomyces sp. RerS4]|uniref:MarR family winged helix-turn-helix transcriptional regulator n=1 Tax=Streptomyces sp. RerS4 TaxID=2942449 RepID=UPI00201BF8BF|nr:MarR family winged helix-turn-helix transcriptional regulator [Streptomyces sp. RerS4]UQX01292.1 MarR family winged helix-turn-helix transcriptional regulator [Streptomyces sp. RerS4]
MDEASEPTPRWLTEPEQQAWYAWRRMFPLVNAGIARDLAQDSGLSEADYDVLSVLGSTDGHRTRVSALAVLMQWSRSRLSHQLTRMQQRGLVRREEVASDGRGAEVVLTPAGVAAITAAAPPHVESVRRHLIDVLTPEQLATLAEIGETLRVRLGVARKGSD